LFLSPNPKVNLGQLSVTGRVGWLELT
jgi:hypothetical protein